jgi:hypothetical protein
VLRLSSERTDLGHNRKGANRKVKYMLMMSATQADFEWYAASPKEALHAHHAFMRTFTQELIDDGTYVAGEGLAFPDQARLVRAASDGSPVTDGVFPESKEFLAGYWIVDVENAEEAYRLAARISTAPHPPYRDGSSQNQPVEVRQIMSAAPEICSGA